MALELVEMNLPTFWAPALINGDSSGLSRADQLAFDCFMRSNPELRCVEVKDDAGFCWHHEANIYGVLACECATFVFYKEVENNG